LGLSGSVLEERLYCLQDANWNVVAVVSTAGAPHERYCYTAYGKPTFLSGSFGCRGSSICSWDALYTGRQHDVETRFGHFRNRIGLFDLGRFGSRDPAESSPNLYEYVGDDPLTRTDPTGLQQAAEKTYTLYVCVRGIDVKGPGAAGGHVFIILDCGNGPQVFRGGPSGGQNREGCKCSNQLVADSYPYQVAPNPADTPPDIPKTDEERNKISCRKYTIRTAADCATIQNCFNKTIALINKQCLPYKAIPGPIDSGTNSNAVASWLLQNCMKNPPLLLPGGKILPGWPTFLPDFIKNPQPDNKKVSKCCGSDGSGNV
jgi:RHS repeat-associated protein